MRTLQAARWTRRAFLCGLTLAGTAAFLVILFMPLAADPQPPVAVARIAVLAPGAPPTEVQLQRSAFQQTLRELGWHEGQNLVVARHYAEGKLDRLPDLAADLVQGQPHVILTWGTPGVLAAKQATTTIPIVVRGAAALLEQGLVATLARPGGNLTGVENNPLGLDGKRLALLKEAGPRIARVAFLFNPANPLWHFQLPRLEAEARALGLEMQRVEARDPSEFDTAFAAIVDSRVDALFIADDGIFWPPYLQRILDFAAANRLPTLSAERRFAEEGSLMAYGYSDRELARRAATYVDEILKGARPGDLPVERATTFELVINLKTAKALGLTIPPRLLFQADEVIPEADTEHGGGMPHR
jgi:putative ABC transport system substrate-binding protein